MKRIDVLYGGQEFSIAGRELDDVRDEVRAAISAGQGWLSVNIGEGITAPAALLVTPGVPLALLPVAGDDDLDEDPRPSG